MARNLKPHLSAGGRMWKPADDNVAINLAHVLSTHNDKVFDFKNIFSCIGSFFKINYFKDTTMVYVGYPLERCLLK